MSAYHSDLVDKRTCVYRAYIDGELAYVGITKNPAGRFSKHNSQKPWWRDVDGVYVTWFTNRPLALAEERRAILEELPIYNESRPRSGT